MFLKRQLWTHEAPGKMGIYLVNQLFNLLGEIQINSHEFIYMSFEGSDIP